MIAANLTQDEKMQITYYLLIFFSSLRLLLYCRPATTWLKKNKIGTSMWVFVATCKIEICTHARARTCFALALLLHIIFSSMYACVACLRWMPSAVNRVEIHIIFFLSIFESNKIDHFDSKARYFELAQIPNHQWCSFKFVYHKRQQ